MKNFDVRLDTSILNESPGQELSGAISPREGIYPRRSEAFEAGATRALSGLSASDAEPIPSPGHLEPLSDNCVPRPTNLSSVDRNGCSRGGPPRRRASRGAKPRHLPMGQITRPPSDAGACGGDSYESATTDWLA